MTTETSQVAGARAGAFSSILVPVDGSPESERAIKSAAQFDVDRIVLLRVLGGDPLGEVSSPLDLFTGWRREKIDEVTADLERLTTENATAAGSVEMAIRYGNPAEEIIKESAHHDLIVMGSHGRGAAGRRVFGSTTDRVARHGSTPVMIVRTGDHGIDIDSAQRLVVPLDGSELAEGALPIAGRVARMLDIPLHLVRVVGMNEILATVRARRKEDVDTATSDDPDPYEVARIATEAEATSYLSRVASALTAEGFQVTEEMRGGTPAFELLWVVTENDIVVMTSRGQGGFQRWSVGSVAEKMVREAKAPVLLVPIEHPGEAG